MARVWGEGRVWIVVRVWGEGLLDHRLPGPGRPSKFMVDTTDAGSGMLGIKVRIYMTMSYMYICLL